MSRKAIWVIAIALAAGVSSGASAQQPPPMAGMKGMKDSVTKVKRPSKKTKTTAKKKAVPKKSKGSMGGMKMSSRKTHYPPLPTGRGKTGHTAHDSKMRMTMPMADSMHMRDSSMAHKMMTPMPKHDSTSMSGMTMGRMTMGGMKPMTADDMMIGPLGVSMERMGSGTTWIPDAVTMPSRRTMMGSWMIMAHGFAFAQYDHQTGKRGDDQFGSLNWAMLMATKNVAGGRFQARTMLSLDALTVTSKGYPLLLQTGEAFEGQPLHDRQHPHDFFMELGALYQREFSPSLGWSLYAAPSGEPALGPVAFMHRPSAMDNPSAPISHHWQDATHVSFGVITGGLFTRTVQVEASVFNGREPDQRRWNLEPIKLDSYSSRLTLNPNAAWSFSAGYGYMKSPEALHPTTSMHRVTASVLNGRRIGSEGQVASALMWGANKHSGEQTFSHSLLAESEAILDRRNTLFGRAEWVQKSAEDLVVDRGIFNVSTAQLGYIREMMRTHWATVGLGAAGTMNFVPSLLGPVYGSRTPLGLFVFLRVRPFHERSAKSSGMKMPGHE